MLAEGLVLHLYTDDADDAGRLDNVLVDGVAHFDTDTGRWVATINWNAIRHESDPPDK